MGGRFDSLRKTQPTQPDSLDQFIQGAVDRVEGTTPTATPDQRGNKKKVIFYLDAVEDGMIVKISNRPEDFKCSKSNVVTAAVRAFYQLPVDEQIRLLQEVIE
jgi:hypothetical protein